MSKCVELILQGNPSAYTDSHLRAVEDTERKNTFPKAKPGKYKNILMRSQLEISIAKEFDKYEIRWWYEPAVPMTKYGDHKHCKPDFYLPDYDVFVEVRPEDTMDTELDLKCEALEREYGRVAYRINVPRDIPELMQDYVLKYHGKKKTASV